MYVSGYRHVYVHVCARVCCARASGRACPAALLFTQLFGTVTFPVGTLQGRRTNFAGFTGELPTDWATANTPDKLVVNRTSGFRVDSRWVGAAVHVENASGPGAGAHVLFATTENGYLYIARDVTLLAVGVEVRSVARHIMR